MGKNKSTGDEKSDRSLPVRKTKGLTFIVDEGSNVIESLIYSRARINGGIYVQRFLMRLTELAQNLAHDGLNAYFEGRAVTLNKYDFPEVCMSVKDILGEDDESHYSRAIEAVRSLLDCKIEIEDEDVYRGFNFITEGDVFKSVAHGREAGTIKAVINPTIWEKFVTFSKGYSLYNIRIACSLNYVLSVRIYKGLSNQKGAISYSMDAFRKAYDLEDKYRDRNSDLVKYVIEPARRELYEKADYSFDYVLGYGYPPGIHRGRKSIVSIEIVPKRIFKNTDTDSVRRMVHPAQIIGTPVYDVLTKKLYFTFVEVKANVKLFDDAVKRLGEDMFLDWLDKVAPHAFRADYSVQGYVVNSLKKYMLKKFGLSYCKAPSAEGPYEGVEPDSASEAGPDDGVSDSFKDRITGILSSGSSASSGLDSHQHHIGDVITGSLF